MVDATIAAPGKKSASREVSAAKIATDIKSLSFVDVYGATVTIPRGEVLNYLCVRSEGLRALTQLLAAQATGSLDLSPSMLELFHLSANELACSIERIVELVPYDLEGGAA